MIFRREYHGPCAAPITRQAAPPPPDLDAMLDAALAEERRTSESVQRAAERVKEAERIAHEERQILTRAQVLARNAAETVRVLRQRVAARAEELASLEF